MYPTSVRKHSWALVAGLAMSCCGGGAETPGPPGMLVRDAGRRRRDASVVDVAWPDAGLADAYCVMTVEDASGECVGSMGGLDEDRDGDGFTPATGDCLDCSAQVSPAAFDDPSTALDEDCDGSPASLDPSCDEGLAIDGTDPFDAARAMGLCPLTGADEPGWGVVSARWTRPDGTGTPVDSGQFGLLPFFGSITPRQGRALLALSSGLARETLPDADTPHSRATQGELPRGLITASPACPFEVSDLYDAVALELRIRVPTNARAFRFSSMFFTREYPEFICSPFNDYFAVLMDPPPAGSPDGNVVFDSDGNRITVNTSLLAACEPGNHGGTDFTCPLGTHSLERTGYDLGASTGWLSTEVPVDPRLAGREIVLRFAIWDSSDPIFDSTVLIDAFEWLAQPVCNTTTEPLF